MGKAIVVVSGKGGTGKTTTVAALASLIAARGHRTLCIDCDVGLKNLDLHLGMTGLTNLDFFDILEGSKGWMEVAVEHPDIENLWFISAPAMADPQDVDPKAFMAFLEEVKACFEYCFIDAPAGIGAGFRLACSGADEAIVVSTGDAAGLRDGQRTVAELKRQKIQKIRLLVNRLRPKMLREISSTVDDIIDLVGARLIGVVSESDQVALSGDTAFPLVMMRPCHATQQFNRISRRLEGEKVPLGQLR